MKRAASLETHSDLSVLATKIYIPKVGPALTTMQYAVSMAVPHKYRRTFLDEGTPVLELLQRLLEQDLLRESSPRMVEYVQSLLSLAEVEVVSTASSQQIRHHTLIEPLTKRESTILRLLSQGHSNAEIASALGLSIGTVKGYNHQIFGKLGVKNRVQAVSKAKEWNLLQ
jgi:LuxR family transcriptional regulator, maltose regulon positive regulatory protein